MRYRLDLSYDGGCFNGWQKQKIGPPTVQGSLEAILAQILRSKTRVVGAGRTDAGVHAFGQVAHFEFADTVGPSIHRSLSALAPEGLIVKSVWQAAADFHSLASSIQKTYVYRIWNSPIASPFQRHYSLWVSKPLDLERLNALSSILMGEHDFKSFQTRGTPVRSTVRTIQEACWIRRSSRLFEFRISGGGFLKQMVRNIVGTLLYLERKGMQPADLAAILAAEDRQAAKATAPPHGLYLLQVKYPAALDNQCRKI